MALFAVSVFVLLLATSAQPTDDVTAPSSASYFVNLTPESSSDTNDITTTDTDTLQSYYTTTMKSPSPTNQENGTTSNYNTTTTKEAATTYKSLDEVDNGDFTTKNDTTEPQNSATTAILPTQEENDENFTSNDTINTTTSTETLQNSSNFTGMTSATPKREENDRISDSTAVSVTKREVKTRSDEGKTAKKDEGKAKKTDWTILSTLLSIMALAVVGLIVHAKWKRICNVRNRWWVQACGSGSKRREFDEEEFWPGNCGENGFGEGAEREIEEKPDEKENCNVTLEETKL